jgi:hypothetical protein
MRTAAALVAAGLALAPAGCGSDQRADFRSDLRSLDGRVQRLADARTALSRAASR